MDQFETNNNTLPDKLTLRRGNKQRRPQIAFLGFSTSESNMAATMMWMDLVRTRQCVCVCVHSSKWTQSAQQDCLTDARDSERQKQLSTFDCQTAWPKADETEFVVRRFYFRLNETMVSNLNRLGKTAVKPTLVREYVTKMNYGILSAS